MFKNSAFNEVLNSLRIGGTLLLAEEYRTPWAIEIPEGQQFIELLGVPTDTIIVPFHFVRRGVFTLHSSSAEPILIRAGEAVICTGSRAHTMQNGSPPLHHSFAECVAGLPVPRETLPDATSTELICGVFTMRNSRNNPLLAALPDRIHVNATGKEGKNLEILAQLLVSELDESREGKGFMLDRVLELFCAESIRVYMSKEGAQPPGWFRGLQDQRIGPILNEIHDRPGSPISVASMARSAGMSESRFAARFRSTLGESPMSYVCRWRMNLASRLLMDSEDTIECIGNQVGYESLPAFSRAFRKHLSLPPGQWRKRQRQVRRSV